MKSIAGETIKIIGAGLAGTVLGIYLAREGYPVEIFERNFDPRKQSEDESLRKSVNLTLAARGLEALDAIGIGNLIRKLCVPATGRLIHHLGGEPEFQPYGNQGEALLSLSRRDLIRFLLNTAQIECGIPIYFGQKCSRFDFEKGKVVFEDQFTGENREVESKVWIGADGVHSAVRTSLETHGKLHSTKNLCSHANKELRIPAAVVRENQLQENALHVWPRGRHMLISFPNLDGSFSCTLHLPLQGEEISFESIRHEGDLFKMFYESFPDALKIIPNLERQYFSNPTIAMTTIRSSTWHLGGKVLLLGDSAHGIWPAYGQGANACFEDCQVLVQCLRKTDWDFETAFARFEAIRHPQTDAIANLSEQHFLEIRDQLRDPRFLLKKRVERKINQLFPELYKPLYARVSFTTESYTQAIERDRPYRGIIQEILDRADLREVLDSPKTENWIRQKILQKKIPPHSLEAI